MSKVKHIVLLKFNNGTNEEQIEQFFETVLDLSETVSGVEDYVSGTNCSLEAKNQGLTHGFIMTFKDAAHRDAYLASEAYIQYRNMATPMIESSVVFDFEV